MRVRSLNSRVFTWPNAKIVDEAVRRWAERLARERPEVCRVGYFGSYARGDWGVGSDVDVIVIVDHAIGSWERRGVDWGPTGLPVPADLLIYTSAEWEALPKGGRFRQTVEKEAVWVFPPEGQSGGANQGETAMR